MIITRTSNEKLGANFQEVITSAANKSGVVLHPITSGMVESGADLGSSKVRFITKPKVALVLSDQTASGSFGEIWHFFEQQIGYPLSTIRSEDIPRINLNEFNVLIFPDGRYEELASDKVIDWVRNGGKMIAMENAVAQVAGKKGFSIKVKEEKKDEKDKDDYAELKTYENRTREDLRSSIPGAIYKVNLDTCDSEE